MTLSIFTINIFFINTLGYKDNPFTMIVGVQSNSNQRGTRCNVARTKIIL